MTPEVDLGGSAILEQRRRGAQVSIGATLVGAHRRVGHSEGGKVNTRSGATFTMTLSD